MVLGAGGDKAATGGPFAGEERASVQIVATTGDTSIVAAANVSGSGDSGLAGSGEASGQRSPVRASGAQVRGPNGEWVGQQPPNDPAGAWDFRQPNNHPAEWAGYLLNKDCVHIIAWSPEVGRAEKSSAKWNEDHEEFAVTGASSPIQTICSTNVSRGTFSPLGSLSGNWRDNVCGKCLNVVPYHWL